MLAVERKFSRASRSEEGVLSVPEICAVKFSSKRISYGENLSRCDGRRNESDRRQISQEVIEVWVLAGSANKRKESLAACEINNRSCRFMDSGY